MRSALYAGLNVNKIMPKGLKGFQKGNIPFIKGTKGIMKPTFGHLGKKHSIKTKQKIREKILKRYKEDLTYKIRQQQNRKKGLTYTQKKELIAGRKKPFNCELCGKEGKICFDHDHKTGKFRGWICSRCNFVLGHIENTPKEVLNLMFIYLEKYEHKI